MIKTKKEKLTYINNFLKKYKDKLNDFKINKNNIIDLDGNITNENLLHEKLIDIYYDVFKYISKKRKFTFSNLHYLLTNIILDKFKKMVNNEKVNIPSAPNTNNFFQTKTDNILFFENEYERISSYSAYFIYFGIRFEKLFFKKFNDFSYICLFKLIFYILCAKFKDFNEYVKNNNIDFVFIYGNVYSIAGYGYYVK